MRRRFGLAYAEHLFQQIAVLGLIVCGLLLDGRCLWDALLRKLLLLRLRLVGVLDGDVVVGAAFEEIEEALAEALAGFSHVCAGACRAGVDEEGHGDVVVGAAVVGDEARGGIDAEHLDAVGRCEGLHVRVLRELDGAVHERGPDGRGGVGALQLDVGVVVIADPDDAEQVGGVAGEPGVVRGAGFACCWCVEAVGSCGCARAARHDAFEQRLREVGDAWVEYLFGLGCEVGDDVAVGIANAGEYPGREVCTVVGEDGVGTGHVDGCGAVGADGDRRCALGVDDAGGARERGNVAVADLFRERDGGDVKRVFDGCRGRDHAGELAVLEVAGCVGLAVEHKGSGVVVELG